MAHHRRINPPKAERLPQRKLPGHHLAAQRSPDEILADEMVKFRYDPLGYVMFNFPWDTDSTIQLVKLPESYRKRFPKCEFGPDLWQCEFLDQVGAETRRRKFNGREPVAPLYFATVTGHETGKSCLVAWLTKWILDTRPMSKGSLTAVTDEQLRTKTWAEVGKWHRISLTAHWFDYNASRGNMGLVHKTYADWRADARTCREEKSESFAGQHAPLATSFYIFDESSGIPAKIFEVREGGLTSGEPMVFDFGNGTRNSGPFYEECVGKLRNRYIVRSIDSRSVAITNKAKIAQDAADYGEDSDFFKVRWRGLFPDRGFAQFIPTETVEEAMRREGIEERVAPVVFGVDVARFGDDESVIYVRRGRDARSFEPRVFRGLDTVQFTGQIVECYRWFAALGIPPAMIFVDGGGVGGGVVDQLRALGYPVTEVQFGSKPSDNNKYRFRSDEIWGRMRDAVRDGLRLPSRDTRYGERIFSDLTQREYGFMVGGQRIHLETKDAMKTRGLPSPDFGDALALTYAAEVLQVPAGMMASRGRVVSEYDPFDGLRG